MTTAPGPCPLCRGSRWLCEAHLPLRWKHDDCDAPGVPCACRRTASAGWLRLVAAAGTPTSREIDRRRGERFNRRRVERRTRGATIGVLIERRSSERRAQDRRVASD